MGFVLAASGLTVEDVKEWLLGANDGECCRPAQTDVAYTNQACDASGPLPAPDLYGASKPIHGSEPISNVIFCAGSDTEGTQVYVDGVPITGISKANLEYDSELGFPILRLEILKPEVIVTQTPAMYIQPCIRSVADNL